MRALISSQYGSIENLKISDIEKPVISKKEVLVRVKGAALNPADIKVLTGKDGGKFLHAGNFPFALGFDYSGVIEEAGSSVSTVKVNDEVFGFLPYSTKNKQGSFAEYVSVPQGTFARKPKNASHTEAASTATVASTTLQALRDKGRLKNGQRVFINGASGGVGSYAVQIAKIMGAEVWGACSADNSDYVKRLGADGVIDYKTTNFSELRDKFDIFFDVAAVSSFGKCKNILAPKGTYITLLPSLSLLSGIIQSVFSSKACRIVIVKSLNADLSEISQWIDEGKLQMPLDSTFSFEDLPQALSKLETGRIKGKIAVTINS